MRKCAQSSRILRPSLFDFPACVFKAQALSVRQSDKNFPLTCDGADTLLRCLEALLEYIELGKKGRRHPNALGVRELSHGGIVMTVCRRQVTRELGNASLDTEYFQPTACTICGHTSVFDDLKCFKQCAIIAEKMIMSHNISGRRIQ